MTNSKHCTFYIRLSNVIQDQSLRLPVLKKKKIDVTTNYMWPFQTEMCYKLECISDYKDVLPKGKKKNATYLINNVILIIC